MASFDEGSSAGSDTPFAERAPMPSPRLASSVAPVLTVGCGPPPPTDDATAVRASLDSVNARIIEFFAAGQADSLAALYLPDAIIFNANAKPIVGRDSIAAYFRRMLTGASWAVNLETQSVHAQGTLAVAHGRYGIVLTFEGAPDAPVTDLGHTVTAWRRTADGWRVLYDVATSESRRRSPGS